MVHHGQRLQTICNNQPRAVDCRGVASPAFTIGSDRIRQPTEIFLVIDSVCFYRSRSDIDRTDSQSLQSQCHLIAIASVGQHGVYAETSRLCSPYIHILVSGFWYGGNLVNSYRWVNLVIRFSVLQA